MSKIIPFKRSNRTPAPLMVGSLNLRIKEHRHASALIMASHDPRYNADSLRQLQRVRSMTKERPMLVETIGIALFVGVLVAFILTGL